MYCKNCGNICKDTDVYCDQCGQRLQEKKIMINNPANHQLNPPTNNISSNDDNNKANLLGTISLVCLALPFILDKILMPFSVELKENIISSISGLSLLAGVTLMIFVRVKYPRNILGKVVMWLFILGFIFFIVCIFLVMFACFAFLEELKNCPGY